MAFKRENFKSLVSTKKEYFASSYGFKGKTNFSFGSDVYVIPLLSSGFYEIPCHRVITHKVDGKEIGFNGASFPIYVRCKGVSEEGANQPSLCCTLSQMEKERIPEKNDSGKRIISNRTWRVFFPVLILGSSLADETKTSYPVSKVAISKDLASEAGLKLSYLEMSNSTFKKDIVTAYGNNLRDKGILDYDLDPDTEEFFEEIRNRLSRTVVKIHGGTKTGFTAPIKEYSFFPFEDPAIACQSAPGERDSIINYDSNDQIMLRVSEFLTLFDTQVDSLIRDWNEKDLQEYYNSARGFDIHTSLDEIAKAQPVEETPVVETQAEKVEFTTAQPAQTATFYTQPQVDIPAIQPAAEATSVPVVTSQAQAATAVMEKPAEPVSQDQPYGNVSAAASDEEIENLLKVSSAPSVEVSASSDADLDDYDYDLDNDGDFFG